MAKRFPKLGKDDFVSVEEIIRECKNKNDVKRMKLYDKILESASATTLALASPANPGFFSSASTSRAAVSPPFAAPPVAIIERSFVSACS